MKKSLLAAIVLIVTHTALSQTWNLTETNDWECIASSANGSTLITGQWPGDVAVSTNAGVTWTTVMTNQFWNSVAASADGMKLLAASANVDSAHTTGVFLSTNAGAGWVSNSLPSFYWGSVAISADGNTIAAVAPIASGSDPATVCAIFCSTNSGNNWVSNNLNLAHTLGQPSPVSVAMSADGRKIFVVDPEEVSYSTNSGATWMLMTNAPITYAWLSPSQVIASSADGNKLIMCIPANPNEPYEFSGVFVSTNCGNTWSLSSLPQTNAWGWVASSADGKTLMASGTGFYNPIPLCISTNSGTSWTINSNENWAGVACSADGGGLVAVGGAIYRSQSIQPPLMRAAPSGDGLLVSWLIPSTNFGLEQSGDLYNWSTVTNAPVLNMANLDEQIVVSATNGAGFYRLATFPGH
jgi:hypothetical protein